MANTKITPHVLDSTFISGHSTVTAATNDFVLIQDVSDSNALKKALVSDLAQNEESPTFTGNVVVNGTAGIGTSSIDSNIKLQIEDSAYPVMALDRSASLADGNHLGYINFQNNGDVYGYIGGWVEDVSETDGELRFATQKGTSLTDKMVITSDGNVGIGATSPSQKLHVVGKIKSTDDLIIGGTNPRIDYDGGSTGSLRFYSTSASAERMRIDSSGNVGIGVTPEAWHADWEVLRIGERAAFYSQASTTTGIGENVYYDSGWKAIATAAGSLYQQDSGNHHFYTMASVSADATSTPSEKFTILNSGNVGINHSSPEHDLHVTHAADNEDGIVKIGGSSSSLGLELRYDQAGATQTQIIANPTYTNVGSLMKLCVDGDANANQLVLMGSGNVGIGNASPGDKFEVLGSSTTYDIGTDASAEVVAAFIPNSTNDRNGRLRIAGTTTPHNNSMALISDSSTNVGMSFVTTSGGTKNENMIITSDGHVTQPNQPVAIYTHSASTEAGAYQYAFGGTGAQSVTCKPQLAVVNRGSMYNASNGRFTAPVAGTYRYAVHGNMYTNGLHANAYWTYRIYKNASHWLYHYQDNSVHNANGWVYQNVGGLITLAASEYLTFELKTNNLVSNNFGMDLNSYTHYEFALLY